jgi:hypothetical protein
MNFINMKIEHTKEIQKLKAQLQPVQTGQQASSSSRFFGSRNEPLDNASESLCSRKILAVVSPKFVRITRRILSPDSSGVRHALAHSGLRAVATTMT